MLRRIQSRVLPQQGRRRPLGRFEQRGTGGKIRIFQSGNAVLPQAEQIAGSPQPQILLGNPEAVIRPLDRPQAFGGRLPFRIGDEDTAGGIPSPADPPAELVQLRKPKTLGVLNHHDGGVGHVHPNLDNGGGHQKLNLPREEAGHYRLLLGGAEPAVQQAHRIAAKSAFPQPFGIFDRRNQPPGPRGFLPGLLDQRTNQIGLPSLVEAVAHEAKRPLPLLRVDAVGGDRRAPGRKLPDQRDVEIAVEDQRKGSWNWGGAHHQSMHRPPLGRKGRTLCHSKAVLFVGNDKSKGGKPGGAGQQGVGADKQINLSGL